MTRHLNRTTLIFSLVILALLAAGLYFGGNALSGAAGQNTNAQQGTGPNLALNKPTTASGVCVPGTEAPKANNGTAVDVYDKWCDNTSASKWWQVDLGANYTLTHVAITHAGVLEPVHYNTRGFNVQVSTDAVNWTTVATVTNNAANTTSSAFAQTNARYVKLNITQADQLGNSAARIFEVSVYGTGGTSPTSAPTVSGTIGTGNLALNKPAISSSVCLSSTLAGKANNGTMVDVYDKWCDNSSVTKYWQVDLRGQYSISQIMINHAGAIEGASFNTRAYNVQISANGGTWTTVATVTNNTANSTFHTFPAATAQFVRLNITQGTQTDNSAARIYEVQVYSTAQSTPVPQPTATKPPTSIPPTLRPNLVVDPGFEAGSTSWKAYYATPDTHSYSSRSLSNYLATTPVHAGSRSLALCKQILCDDESVKQTLTVVLPANATLTFWVRMVTQQTTQADDKLKVLIIAPNIGTIEMSMFHWETTPNQWIQKTISIAGYAGKTVTLEFLAKNGPSGLTTWYIDDVEIR